MGVLSLFDRLLLTDFLLVLIVSEKDKSPERIASLRW
jgi:hypothetical protein